MKAKPAKIVKDVLGPILSQYGWNLKKVDVLKDGKNPVDLDSTVASIDNCRLLVLSTPCGPPPTTDEINSIIFEEVMKSKRNTKRTDEDQVSLRTSSSVSSSLEWPSQYQNPSIPRQMV